MPTYNKIGHLQFAWFGGTDPNHDSVVSALTRRFGRAPSEDSRLAPPQAPAPMRGTLFIHSNATIRVQSQVGRLDVIVSPIEHVRGVPSLPMEALSTFERLYEDCGTVFEGSFRQAFHLRVFSEPLKPQEIGAEFGALLASDADLSRSIDLIFQMNSRSTIDGFDINRIARWSGEALETFQLVNGLQHGIEQVYFISYLLDVNTVPTNDQSIPSRQRAAFAALVKGAKDMIKVQKVSEVA